MSPEGDSQPESDSKSRSESPATSPATSVGGAAPKAVWMRLAGSGMELAFITVVFGAIGLAVDKRLGLARPVASALGGLVGFVLGMVRFIRQATAISEAERKGEVARAASARAASPERRGGTDETERTDDERPSA